MKNFKKVLALVLAVVMLLSFATVASAVTTDFYKDVDDIDYKEAVDVLGLIGVLEGYPDDTFRPEKTITRAEAAKIIAMFDNKSSKINGLYASANPFSDCVDHWAESYIAYGAKTGIIAGVGGDKFAPSSNVTGVQFLKMVLVVLGYDAKAEGLEGKNWDVNTLALAKRVGLTKTLGVKFDYSADLKRQEAAVIMLDALQADTVVYGNALGANVSKLISEIEKFNKTVDEDDPTSVKKAFAGLNVNGVIYVTVVGAVKTGDKLMKDWGLKQGYYEDAFMRPYTTWTLGTKTLYYMYNVEAEYTAANTLCNVYVDLGYAKTDLTELKIQHYVNGAPGAYNGDVDGHDKETTAGCGLKIKLVGSQGTLTQVFLMDDGSYRVTEIETWLGRVSDVKKTTANRDGHLVSTKTVTVEVAVDGDINAADAIVVEFASDAFTKGEWVLVTYSEKIKNDRQDVYGVQSVTSAKTETAQFTGLDADETKVGAEWKYDAEHFYVGKTGTQYGAGFPFINVNDGEKLKLPQNLKGTYKFIYDAYGNVIGMVDADKAADEYLVIDWMYLIANAGKGVVKANVVGLDAKMNEAVTVAAFKATFGDFDIDIDADDITTNGFISGGRVPFPAMFGLEYGVNWKPVYDHLLTYSVNADGEYILGLAAGVEPFDDVAIKDGDANLYEDDDEKTGLYLTDDTQILIHEMDGSYTAATGKDVGTIYAGYAEVIADEDTGIIDVIYLCAGEAGYLFRESSVNVGYLSYNLDNPPKIEIVDDLEVTKVDVYFGGELKSIYIDGESWAYVAEYATNKVGFHNFQFTDVLKDGKILCNVLVDDESIDKLNAPYEVVALSGNTVVTDKGAYKVSADVTIYDVYRGVVTKVTDGELTDATVLLGFNGAGVVTTIYCLAG